MSTIEIRVPKATKVLSIKVDTYIDSLIQQAAARYGFDSKSDFIRFIICNVLSDLGLLSEEDEYLCYHRIPGLKKKDDDPDLLIALANTVATLRGLDSEKALGLVADYVELLEALA